MAEGSVIDYPATPDRLDQCPATPDPLLPIKSPDSSSASSDNEESVDPSQASTSPPPNCAICLGKCKNKCFTDSCLHQFCFKCLLEWSRVKAECPLCKQAFKSIIHNVKSIDQFEEYLVQQPPPVNLSQSTRIYHHLNHLPLPPPRVVAHSNSQRNNSGFRATVQIHNSNNNNNIDEMFLNPVELLEMFRQQFPEGSVPSGRIAQLWRRNIYDRRLYALPLPDLTGRFRECSARFYRENPGQVHRLMPFLNRDLVTLVRNTEQNVGLVLSAVSELLTIFNIGSADFRRRITSYFGNNTSHFIHEMLNFARSPFDMIGYDREVRYTQSYEEIIVNTSSDDSDSEVVSISQVADRIFSSRLGRSRLGFTIETSSRDSSFRITLGSDSNSGNSNSASTSQTTAINLTTNNNPVNNEQITEGDDVDGNSSADPNRPHTPQVLGETQVIEIEHNSSYLDRNITLSSSLSSSSDECEFVLEQKPPHLRTPEMVSLNSESDSDVVFVSEVKSIPPKHKRQLARDTIYSSTDSSSGSESELESTKVTKDVAALADLEAIDSMVKNEYNQGASTSSGLKNGAAAERTSKSKKRKRSSASKIKNARPTRLAGKFGGGRGLKKMFECSRADGIYSSDSSDLSDFQNINTKSRSVSSKKSSSSLTSSDTSEAVSSWSGEQKNKRKIGKNNRKTGKSTRNKRDSKNLKTKRMKRHSLKSKQNDHQERSSNSTKKEKKLKLQSSRSRGTKTGKSKSDSRSAKTNFKSKIKLPVVKPVTWSTSSSDFEESDCEPLNKRRHCDNIQVVHKNNDTTTNVIPLRRASSTIVSNAAVYTATTTTQLSSGVHSVGLAGSSCMFAINNSITAVNSVALPNDSPENGNRSTSSTPSQQLNSPQLQSSVTETATRATIMQTIQQESAENGCCQCYM